jgi:hypothetical protein
MREYLTNEYTETIQKVIREVVNDPSTYLGSKYIPSVAMPVRKIRTEVIEATGGLTQEHVLGTAPKTVQRFGMRVQEYEPPAYKEAKRYDEADILFLREIGQNGRNVRGVQKYIDEDIGHLNRRIEARIEKQRWESIFDGGFSYAGKTLSFGVPASNRAVPIGALWSLDSVSANNAANPLVDIRYWLEGGLGAWRKYVITELVMNPNTARWILDNSNTRSYIQNAYANPKIQDYSLEQVLGFFLPGGPKVTVYKGWYQSESFDTAGKRTVSNAIYMIPDGQIYAVATLPGGDKIGEFVQGVHLASGSIDNPGYGKFLVMDDNTAPGTKGGPSNPYLEIVGGVYGGVKLDRAFDVLTAKVIA